MDWIIRNAWIPGWDGRQDIAIQDGVIFRVAPRLDETTKEELDARGRLVTPGLIDAGLCAGTALMTRQSGAVSLSQAWPAFLTMACARTSGERLAAGRTLLRRSLSSGVTAVRVPVWTAPGLDDEILKDLLRLRGEFEEQMRVSISAAYHGQPATYWSRARDRDGVEGLTVNLDADGDTDALLYRTLELGRGLGLQVSFLCGLGVCAGEGLPRLERMAEMVCEEGMQGRVLCYDGGCLDEKGADGEEISLLLHRLARAGVSFVVSPSLDLQLRPDRPRSGAPLKRLEEAGIPVCISCGHVGDTLCPFGTGDPVREAMLAAQVHKYGTGPEMERLLSMITCRPARALGWGTGRIEAGASADLVIWKEGTAGDVVRAHSGPLCVIRGGKRVQLKGEE